MNTGPPEVPQRQAYRNIRNSRGAVASSCVPVRVDTKSATGPLSESLGSPIDSSR